MPKLCTLVRYSALLLVGACSQSAAKPAEPDGPLVIRHARRIGGELMTVVADHGVVTAILGDEPTRSQLPANAHIVDAAGRWLVPGFIDSHVHAAYFPAARGLPAKGVVAAVDLGMPLQQMQQSIPNLTMKISGPLLTAPGGYPTRSWGRDGYGLEVADASRASAIVDDLAVKGARVVKLALVELDEDVARALVEAAHARGLLVAAHALDDAHAAMAARIGCDVLAHTPVEPLEQDTVAAWSRRAVVSTLTAFGDSQAAVLNLRRLQEAGAKVLYGTDLGNTRRVGIDGDEVKAMMRAGMTLPAVIASATFVPARLWGFEGLGEIKVGARASFFLTAEDPSQKVEALTAPIHVFVDGRELH